MALDFTVLVPARNAASTVQRALRSLQGPLICEVVLVDDFSSDETVEAAGRCADRRLRIVRPNRHLNVPFARNRGVLTVETDWLIWCDADDAFEPGRIEVLAALLASSGADCASDGVRLYDGPADRFLRELPIPGFLAGGRAVCRIFERNFLPAVGHLAVRTALAKEVLYDSGQTGGDDYDFALRLIQAGAKFCLSANPGYRMYAYPGSDSRRLTRQNAMIDRALRKHDYADVEALYRRAGLSDRIAAWGIFSMAMFRREFQAARIFLERACPEGFSAQTILEPEGPYPVLEGWRYAFARGVLHLLAGEAHQAVPWLEKAESVRTSADTANNLGVALWQEGRTAAARRRFHQAIELFPGYLDAGVNLQSDLPGRVTLQPLRMQPSRSDYRPEAA